MNIWDFVIHIVITRDDDKYKTNTNTITNIWAIFVYIVLTRDDNRYDGNGDIGNSDDKNDGWQRQRWQILWSVCVDDRGWAAQNFYLKMMAMVTLATVMITMMDDNNDKFYGVCVSLMTELELQIILYHNDYDGNGNDNDSENSG